jgi:hypothetical protein
MVTLSVRADSIAEAASFVGPEHVTLLAQPTVLF